MLIEQIGAELGHRYGWKSETARRLRVTPSYINKVLADDVGVVGREIADRAIMGVRISAAFFEDPSIDASDYHSFLERERARDPKAIARTLAPIVGEWEAVFDDSATLLRAFVERTPISREVAETAANAVMNTVVVKLARRTLEARTDEELQDAARGLAYAIMVDLGQTSRYTSLSS